MSDIKFVSTKLNNAGKKGVLTPDSDGYYELIIGGLNVFNSAGEFYLLNGAEALFTESSTFMRRVKNGCLRGELGHPKKPPGMTDKAYLDRIYTIDESNICCHFKEVWLDVEYGKKNPELKNPQLVAIMAKLKPSGPKGSSLKESLDNPDENVCFSIRALTRDFYQRGVNNRVLDTIVTFDNVNEGGIHVANKWQAPALENLVEGVVTREIIEDIIHNYKTSGVATESNMALAVESLKSFEPSVNALPLYSTW
jgi:hypothetical protein